MNEYNITWVDILSLILFLLGVYFVLTRIFSHSATDLTISITLFGLLGGVLYKLWTVMFNFNREFGEFKISTINSFEKVKADIYQLREEFQGAKRIVSRMDKKLSRIIAKHEFQ